MSQDTVTPKEAAKILGISNATIYRWLKRGWINGIILPNGYIRISRIALSRILEDKSLFLIDNPIADRDAIETIVRNAIGSPKW
jgi:excisionase family DNA binding protein